MSAGAFTIFYWSLGGLVLLMLIFEDKLLKLESKYDEWKKNKKKERHNGNTKRYKGM